MCMMSLAYLHIIIRDGRVIPGNELEARRGVPISPQTHAQQSDSSG